MGHCGTEELVQRCFLVARRAALAKAEVPREMKRHFDARSSIDSLVKVFIQESCSYEDRVVSWHITEVCVCQIECYAGMYLHPQRKKTLSEPEIQGRHGRIRCGFVDLHGMIHRKQPLE